MSTYAAFATGLIALSAIGQLWQLLVGGVERTRGMIAADLVVNCCFLFWAARVL